MVDDSNGTIDGLTDGTNQDGNRHIDSNNDFTRHDAQPLQQQLLQQEQQPQLQQQLQLQHQQQQHHLQ
jgi:hypothetical protein